MIQRPSKIRRRMQDVRREDHVEIARHKSLVGGIALDVQHTAVHEGERAKGLRSTGREQRRDIREDILHAVRR